MFEMEHGNESGQKKTAVKVDVNIRKIISPPNEEVNNKCDP